MLFREEVEDAVLASLVARTVPNSACPAAGRPGPAPAIRRLQPRRRWMAFERQDRSFLDKRAIIGQALRGRRARPAGSARALTQAGRP